MTDFNLLSSWKLLNTHLDRQKEDELLDLINYELLGNRRKYFIERLHQRYCVLRDKREREEFTRGLK